MTIDRLRDVLQAIGPPATGRDIAEMLWLAARIGAPDTAADAAGGPPPPPPRVPASPGEPRPAAPDGPDGDVAPPPGAGAAGELHKLRTTRPARPGRDTRGGDTVLVPTAPMLQHPLALQRALRPLKRRVPSRHLSVLDEEATAERAADRPYCPNVPVLVPATERWTDLALVADTGPSMDVWRPLVRELREALLRLGAFRDVRVWPLADTGTRVGVRPSPGGPVLSPAALADPAGRRVVLVLSDCSGPHWWEGRAGRALHLWASNGPTAILQPLPERLWHRTAAPTVAGPASAPRPLAPNTALRFTPREGRSPAVPGTVPVPVLEISPQWLADWAALITASGGTGVPTTGVSTTGVPTTGRPTTGRPTTGVAATGIPTAITRAGAAPRSRLEPVTLQQGRPIGRQVEDFQAAASREAAELAAHLAVSVPALPVMRLIQQRIVPGARPGHLAEVLLSGLLRARGPDAYEFMPGAREALLATLPRSESLATADVLAQVTAEISSRAGSAAETFRAVLRAAAGTGDRALDLAERPFALVSDDALRFLGRPAGPAGARTETVALICAVELGGPEPVVRRRLRLIGDLVEAVDAAHPAPDRVRVAAFGYRDHGQTVSHQWLTSARALRAWLPALTPAGPSHSGTTPVEDVLHEVARRLVEETWHDRAILLTVGGRPPRPPRPGRRDWRAPLASISGTGTAMAAVVDSDVQGAHPAWQALGSALLHKLDTVTPERLGAELDLLPPPAAPSTTATTGGPALMTAPGLRLAIAGSSGTIHLWNPRDLPLLRRRLSGHRGQVHALTPFTDRNGRPLLASAGEDGTLRIWDTRTRAQVGRPMGHRPMRAMASFPGPDDRPYLAVCCEEPVVEIWNPLTGVLGRSVEQPSRPLAIDSFSGPGGRPLVAVGGEDGAVRIWGALDGHLLAELGSATEHRAPVHAVAAFTMRGGTTLLAAGSRNGVIRIWHPLSGSETILPISAHRGAVATLASFTDPDGRALLASGGRDTVIRVWDPATGIQVGRSLTGHDGPVSSVTAFSDATGPTFLASGGGEGTVRIFDPAAGERSGFSLAAQDGPVSAVIALPVADTEPEPEPEPEAPGRLPEPEPRAARPRPSLRALLDSVPEPVPGRLNAPLGVDEHGSTVMANLSDTVRTLISGGSEQDRSDLLRTITLGLAEAHSSAALNVLMVARRDSGRFAPLQALPHMSNLVTVDEVPAGQIFDGLHMEFERRLRSGPRPSLLVVLEELGDLLTESPAILDSLHGMFTPSSSGGGMHLLATSHTPPAGSVRPPDGWRRICLRTNTGAESLELLGTADAVNLPAGAAYVRAGRRPARFFTLPQVDAPAVVSAAMRLTEQGPPARTVLPPLRVAPVSLDMVRSTPAAGPGPETASTGTEGGLTADIGVLLPTGESRYRPLRAELTGAKGNLAIVGKPFSGKATLLQTVVASLALRYGPQDVRFLCVDRGTGLLARLRGLPHVLEMLADPQSVPFMNHERLVARMREIRATGARAVLVADGWDMFVRGENLDTLRSLLAAGPADGLHTIAAGHQWTDFSPLVRHLFGHRVELRLAAPATSLIDPERAVEVPASSPGRGLAPGGRHFRAALPRIDGLATAGDLPAGIAHLVQAVSEGHPRA